MFDIATSLITYTVYIIPFIRATSLSLRYGDRVEPWLTGMKRSGAGMLQETLLRKNSKVNSTSLLQKADSFLMPAPKKLAIPMEQSILMHRSEVACPGIWLLGYRQSSQDTRMD